MIITIILVVIIIVLFHVNNVVMLNNKIEMMVGRNIVYNPVKVVGEISQLPVYIINLKHRLDRRRNMIKLMNKLGFLNYRFIEPVSKEEVFSKFPKASSVARTSRFLTNLKIFELEKADKFFIFEDDIDIYNNIFSINDVYESANREGYDLLFLEFCYSACHKFKELSDCLFLLKYPICNGVVLYTRDFVNKFKSYLRNIDYSNVECDTLIADMENTGLIKCVGFPLFRQNPVMYSDIETSGKYKKSEYVYDDFCRILV